MSTRRLFPDVSLHDWIDLWKVGYQAEDEEAKYVSGMEAVRVARDLNGAISPLRDLFEWKTP